MNNDIANSALLLLQKLNDLDLPDNSSKLLFQLQEEGQKLIRQSKLAEDSRQDTIHDWNRSENGNNETFKRVTGFGSASSDQMYVTIEDSKKNPILDVIIEINHGMPTVHISQGGGDCIVSAMVDREKSRLMVLDGGCAANDQPESITTDVRIKNERVLSYNFVK